MTKRNLRLDDRMNVLVLAAACVGSTPAFAFEVNTGDSDLYVRWDNTVKYSAAWRVKDRSKGLTTGDPFAANFDDGDRNFNKGLISNRFDLLSEVDVVYKQSYGFRVSGAGWYDEVYNRSNDNNSPSTSNRLLGQYDEFSNDTRDLRNRQDGLLELRARHRGQLDHVRRGHRPRDAVGTEEQGFAPLERVLANT